MGSRLYNFIASTSVERLAALSDGVFAVAITLLVLDLHTPAADLVHSDADLVRALQMLLPILVVYMMSFLTLGIFWIGQQTQLNHFTSTDRDLSWVHLIFLFAVSLMPFSTSLMSAFMSYRSALAVYCLNILFLGVVLLGTWRLGLRHGLVQQAAKDRSCAIQRLAFIMVVQLNMPWRRKRCAS